MASEQGDGQDPTVEDAVGARVRAARVHRGVTLRALARGLNVSPATVSHLEHGKTRLSIDRLRAIADALDTTVEAILATPGDPPGAGGAGTAGTESGADAAVSRAAQAPVTGYERGGWRHYEPLALDPVLRAALEVFVETGYHGASVRDIARRCGLSVSGIYHHHPSKQEMLAAVLDWTMTDLLSRSEAARGEGRDPVERFCHLVECLALYHTHRRELAFVGASEMRSLDRDNRTRITAMRVRQQRMVDEEVDAAVRQGRFTTPRGHDAARAVVTMCTALANWYRPAGPLSPEQIAGGYVEFALAVMGHRDP